MPSMLVSEEERAQSGGLVAGNMAGGLEVCITSNGYTCLPTRIESVGQGNCLGVLHLVGSTRPWLSRSEEVDCMTWLCLNPCSVHHLTT